MNLTKTKTRNVNEAVMREFEIFTKNCLRESIIQCIDNVISVQEMLAGFNIYADDMYDKKVFKINHLDLMAASILNEYKSKPAEIKLEATKISDYEYLINIEKQNNKQKITLISGECGKTKTEKTAKIFHSAHKKIEEKNMITGGMLTAYMYQMIYELMRIQIELEENPENIKEERRIENAALFLGYIDGLKTQYLKMSETATA